MRKGETGLIVGRYALASRSTRFRHLFSLAVARPPEELPKITTVRSVSYSSEPTAKTVGMTRYSDSGPRSPPRQDITFYSSLASSLSDSAFLAVMAHELAHAWLNEHEYPDDGVAREHEADALAREWGFGRELDSLDEEAETVNG